VPQETVPMRKIKEVLRLHFGLGLRQEPDRPEFHRPSNGSPIFGKSSGSRFELGRCRMIATMTGWGSCCFQLAPANRVHTFVPYPGPSRMRSIDVMEIPMR
jgi:hypothetical protein